MTKFSVIIPVYGNVGENLNHCINSLVTQNFTDFEIIISGSKIMEESEKIINGIKIKNIVTETNSLGKLMNEAFKISNGEWLQFWNCDLVCYPDYFKQLNFYTNIYGEDILYTGRPIDIRSIETRHTFTEFFYKSSDLAEGIGCIHHSQFEPFREEFQGYATHWHQELLYRLWKKLTFICLQDLEIVHLPHSMRTSPDERNKSSILSSQLFERMKNG